MHKLSVIFVIIFMSHLHFVRNWLVVEFKSASTYFLGYVFLLFVVLLMLAASMMVMMMFARWRRFDRITRCYSYIPMWRHRRFVIFSIRIDLLGLVPFWWHRWRRVRWKRWRRYWFIPKYVCSLFKNQFKIICLQTRHPSRQVPHSQVLQLKACSYNKWRCRSGV